MIKKKILLIVYDNLKTLLFAFFIAILIRSLLFQPFYIPSSSMEPTLLVGDRIFVSKYAYGYSKHSFPFSPNFSTSRFFSKSPKRGDLVVFKEESELVGISDGFNILAPSEDGIEFKSHDLILKGWVFLQEQG